MPFTTEQFLDVLHRYNTSLWSILGFSAAISFGIYEDVGLLLSLARLLRASDAADGGN